MKTITIIIVTIIVIGILISFIAIKTAQEYEPPHEDHLIVVYNKDHQTIFFNQKTKLYEAYNYGRLIATLSNKEELINLLKSKNK
jgi:hypothetical protein